MLQQATLEVPEKRRQSTNAVSARQISRLQENSTTLGSKSKGLHSIPSGQLLKVSSSREFGRELTTNTSAMEASLPAFSKQKSIVSDPAKVDATLPRRAGFSKVSHTSFVL
jgi:hypothetical protein